MVEEVLEGLHIKKLVRTATGGRARYIDATVGAGGHSWWIVKAGGEVLGIDADKEMLALAREKLTGLKVKLVKGNFREIGKIARREGFGEVEGILFDLGVSIAHFMDMKRGFSFRSEEADLDMRLDPEIQGVTAADLLNGLREDQLEEMFGRVTEKREARKYAKKVCERREKARFKVVGDLLEVIETRKGEKTHPATKLFLALRMAVNSEMENLKTAMSAALELLEPGGRVAVISFHSAEDGVVKKTLVDWEEKGYGRRVTKKAVWPSEEEVKRNPSARSARLRVFEKERQ